jgi:hypothetical protein
MIASAMHCSCMESSKLDIVFDIFIVVSFSEINLIGESELNRMFF